MGKAQSKLSVQVLRDLQQNTHCKILFINFKTFFSKKVDKKELQQWHKGFLKDCPSGTLSKLQFLSIYKNFFPLGDVTAFSNYVFNVFDIDHNQEIDFEEFIKALSVGSRGELTEKLCWAFRLYDIDGDGFISR